MRQERSQYVWILRDGRTARREEDGKNALLGKCAFQALTEVQSLISNFGPQNFFV